MEKIKEFWKGNKEFIIGTFVIIIALLLLTSAESIVDSIIIKLSK